MKFQADRLRAAVGAAFYGDALASVSGAFMLASHQNESLPAWGAIGVGAIALHGLHKAVTVLNPEITVPELKVRYPEIFDAHIDASDIIDRYPELKRRPIEVAELTARYQKTVDLSISSELAA